jgi:hypothetical protein
MSAEIVRLRGLPEGFIPYHGNDEEVFLSYVANAPCEVIYADGSRETAVLEAHEWTWRDGLTPIVGYRILPARGEHA